MRRGAGISFARNRDGQMVMYVTDGSQTLPTANNWIEIYDGNFHVLRRFTDAFAPVAQTIYSARPVDGKICVTTAAFTKGQGGAVDVFDTEGNLLHRLSMNGPGGTLESASPAVPGALWKYHRGADLRSGVSGARSRRLLHWQTGGLPHGALNRPCTA